MGIYIPHPGNEDVAAFIAANVPNPTGAIADDFRTALVASLGVEEPPYLSTDDLWKLYLATEHGPFLGLHPKAYPGLDEGGISSGPWTPADIETALWLDAADASTLTLDGSDNVEQWNDKSGNARHLSQATADKRPAFVATAIGDSMPTLEFDGSSDELVHDTALMPNTYTSFAISKNRNLAATSIVLVQGTTAAAGRVAMYGERDSGNFRAFHLVGGSTGHTMTGDRSGDYVIHGWQRNGATSRIRWNGLTHDGDTSTDTVQNTAFRLAAGFTGFFPIDISEVIVVGGFLSEEECERIEGYLAHKWGMVANLAAEHPYKESAP